MKNITQRGSAAGSWLALSVLLFACGGGRGQGATEGTASDAGSTGHAFLDGGAGPSDAALHSKDSGAQSDARADTTEAGASALDSGAADGTTREADAGSDGGAKDAGSSAESGASEAGASFSAIPLSTPDGTYYTAQVTVEGETFALDVDTGSATLAIAAQGCTSCTSAGVSPLYTPSTAVDQRRTATSTYADGSSWSGEIYQDTVGLGHGTPSVSMDLVAIRSDNRFFNQSTFQGILGLGPSQLVSQGTNAYPSQEYAAGVSEVLAFELCTSSGTMWLGGVDPTAANAAFDYTPLIPIGQNSPYYAINVDDLLMGGTSLGLHSADFQSPIVDTGTSLFYFPTPIFDAMLSAVNHASGYASIFGQMPLTSNGCVQARNGASASTIDAALPAMALKLPRVGGGQDFTVTVPASQSYLLDAGQGLYCLAAGDGGTTQGAILGDAFLSAFVTVIDRASGRVGFAPDAGCGTMKRRTIDLATWRPRPPKPRPRFIR